MLRRDFLQNAFISFLAASVFSRMAWAQALICKSGVTPRQTSGPFYPTAEFQADQLDTNADLVVLDGGSVKAEGDIVIVEGIVRDQNCNVIPGAQVEIWQACVSGRYNHPDDPNTAPLDPHFQYWGKAVTNALGFYRFRTIIPGVYPADIGWDRPPHIHFKVACKGYAELITQMYFKGHKLNDIDQILQSLKKNDQEKLVVDFKPQAGFPHPVGKFDIQIKKAIF